ncbi:MAG: hypothetical protein CVV41_22465, partial [Candidatus Riflebacteria bacterium HGW-Riflebacteria-1]
MVIMRRICLVKYGASGYINFKINKSDKEVKNMSLNKTWLRLISRNKTRTERGSKPSSFKTIFHNIAAGVAGLGFLATSNFAWGASAITAHGTATTVTNTGNVYNVNTTQKSGINAFNAFSTFNLTSGDIANLHLPDGTNNLINFVSSQISIGGTLNAIKDNKIGGNLFFLSSQGLVVGSGGVVNCGAFYAMTPTQDFMDRFVKDTSLLLTGNEAEVGYITSRKFVNHNGVKGGEGVPLNAAGTIVIDGKINAIDNISAHAGNVTLNNGAILTTGVADFSAVVNTHGIAGLGDSGLTMTSTEDGNVELVAVADNVGKLSLITKLATGFSSFTRATSDATVTVNGTVNAKRNATIEAVAVNGRLSGTESVVEYGVTKTVEKYSNANFLSDIKAKVEFGSTARINADNDILINAIAKNIYKSSSANIPDLGLEVLGMVSPINLAAEVVIADTRSDVVVAQGAILNAKKDIKVKAASHADVIAGASTSLAKIRQTPGGLSAGAIYADVSSEAKVTINGNLNAGTTGDSSKGDVVIGADSVNYLDATAAAKTANDNAIVTTAAVIADVDNVAVVQITNTAAINGEKSVTVKSDATSDVSTVAIVETGDQTYAGVAVNVTLFDSDASLDIGCNLDGIAGNVDLSANNLVLQNRSTADSSVGYSKIGQALANAQSNLVSSIFSLSKFTGKLTGGLGSQTGSKFSAAGAIVYAEGAHDSKLTVGPNVKLTAGDKLMLKSSTIIQDVFLQADSVARSRMNNPENGKTSASAGVIYTDIDQNSTVRIADATEVAGVNSTVLTGKTIEISSITKIEYNRIKRMIQAVEDAVAQLKIDVSEPAQLALINGVEAAYATIKANFSALGAEGLTVTDNIDIFVDSLSSLSTMLDALSTLITGEVKVVAQAAKIVTKAADFASYGNYVNMAVSSAIKGANDDNSQDIGLSGAVGLNDFTSNSDVIIGRNVSITSVSPTVDTAISISALTNVDTISAAGHLLPSKGSKSFGGTYLGQDFNSTANVFIAEGSDLSAAGKDISITATNDASIVAAGMSSAMASNGIEGMVVNLVGVSNSTVSIDDEVGLAARNLSLGSLNNTKALNLAGSVMISSEVGIAAGIALNDFEKENILIVGDIDEKYQDHVDEKAGVDKSTTANSLQNRTDAKVTASGKIDAQAKSTGSIVAVGVAGGMTKNDDSGSTGFISNMMQKYNSAESGIAGTINSLGSKFANITNELSGKTSASSTGTHTNPSFSLSVAGSSGLNFVNSTTRADLSGVTIDLGGTTGSNLNVVAINSADVMAFAGSAGIMKQKSTKGGSTRSVGIAGAVGYNDITNITEATVKNSNINNADEVKVFAVNGGSNIAAGLGLQLAANDQASAASSYTLGGSVSINRINNTVNAKVENSTVTGTDALKTDVNVAAYESDLQITGGVQLTIGKEKGAIGAAVNVANITNNVNAVIDGGVYTKINDITVSAMQALTQVNGALAAGIIWGTSDSASIMGAMIYNQVQNNLKAGIKNANITAAGNVLVVARDFRTGNTTSGFESLIERSSSGVDSFLSTDGTEYYDVDASNDVDGTITPLKDQVKNGALIVSGAMALSVADTAVGAAVVINDIGNTFVSKIDTATINALSVNTSSKSDTFLVSAAGGVAASTNNGAGGGSVVWNEIDNDVEAGAVNSAFTSDTIKHQALNAIHMTSVAGQISAGTGKAAVGLAVSYNDIINGAEAYNYATSLTGTDAVGSSVLVEAQNTADVLDIAASIAASEKLGIGGSVAINKVTSNSTAGIDNTYKDDAGVTQTKPGITIDGYSSAEVKATDNSIIKSLAGTVACGGNAGIGGSVAYNEIRGTSGSSLNNVTLDVQSVLVKTDNDAAIWTLAAGIGGGGKVAIQGAAATGEISRTISAKMNNVQLNNTGASVDIQSDSKGDINSSAAVIAVGGKAAVGAGVSVNRIGDTVSASVTGGNLTLKDLELRSKASQMIRTIGAAGSGGGSFGVSGSVAYNKISTTNKAFIDGSAVVTAEDNVGVIAQTDDNLMNYAGVLAIGGTAGVGAAVAVNYITGDTTAYIDNATVNAKGLAGGITANNGISEEKMNNGFISDQSVNITYTLEDQRTAAVNKGIVVDSSATHTLKSFVANLAAAGTAALAGTVNVNQIDGNTKAYINNATINSGVSAGDVTVNAADYTNSSGFVGSVGGAGTVGIGASSDTNKVNRNTSAKLSGVKTGSLAKAVNVKAIAKQGISSTAAGLGIGGVAGVAGTVSVAILSGTTEAIITNSLISLDSMTVNADHWAKTYVLDATAAVGGYAGVGAAVAVNDIRDTVKAEVSNSTVSMNTNGAGAILVKAANYSFLNATAACIGGGLAGLAGNVSVNYMENTVSATVSNSSLGSSVKRAGSINVTAQNSSNISSNIGTVAVGAVGAGASVGVNTLDGKVQAFVDGSNLYAAGNIDIVADESRTVNQYAFTAAGGALGLAGNVMVVSSGQVLSTSSDDGNKEIADAVSSAEQVNSGSIGGTNGALTAEEQAALNGTSNKLSASEAGKSATTVSVGKFFTANSSVINSSAGAVKILATENTNATLTGGSAAVGGAAAGGSVGIANVNRNVGTIVSYATMNAAGNIDVNSEVKGNTNLNMYQGSAGTFAAGTAAYGSIETSGNALTAVSNSSLTNSGNLTIGAKDSSGANAQSYGLTVGSIAAGVLVTEISNAGATNVNLNNNTLNSANNVSVKSEKENSLTAKTVGGAVGLVGAGTGIASTVNDSGNSAITMTGAGSNLQGKVIAFNSTNKPVIVSQANSAAISGLVSAGVSVANSTVDGQSHVNVSGGNTFNAPSVSFNGSFNGSNSVKAVGVSGGFIGSFGYNESNAYNNAKVNVLIGNNTYSSSTDLVLFGSNVVNQTADTSGLNVGGLIASGNNKARAEADTTTKVDLTGDAVTARNLKSIDVKADGSSVHTVKADGNGGGLISIDGLSAYAISKITTVTDAALSGKWNLSGALKLFSNQNDTVSINSDSTRGSLIGYSGTKAENTINSTTRAYFKDSAQVDAVSNIEFQAKNNISSDDDGGYSASGAGYGGITISGAASTATITSKTEATVGANGRLISKGNITGNAMTEAKVLNKVRTVGAGVVANPLADSTTTINIDNKLTTGAGSLLKTLVAAKNVNLAASTNLTAVLTSDSDMQGGLGGYSDANTVSHVTKNNTLDIFGDLFSSNDINLNTDSNAAGQRSTYDLTATADSYNKNSVVAIAKADLDSATTQNNKINIYNGSDVNSVRHINLNATAGRERMTESASEYTWYSTETTGGYSSTASGQRSKNITGTNKVDISGSLIAGIYNKVILAIDGVVDAYGTVSGSSPTPTITSTVVDYKNGITTGITNYANDLFTRYEEVCKLAAEYSGSTAGIGYNAEKVRLLSEMEKYGLYNTTTGLIIGGMSVQFLSLPDMVCSGGNVVINTGSVSGNGSINAKGSPEISITNNTNLYMKVNDLEIVDYGGEVVYNSVSLGSIAGATLPTLSSVITSDPGNAMISVKETWNGNLTVVSGGRTESVTPLTNIEINGDISNPLGKVLIDNFRGDIVIQGKTAASGASVNAREIELKASNGSISQGFSQGITNIGATPEYLYKTYADGQQAAIDGHETSTTNKTATQNNIDESLQQGTWLAGGSVFLNASDININGLIQSGYAEYNITLSVAAQTLINGYDAAYYGQNITVDSLRNYKLNNGGAKLVSGIYKYEVQAYYNPQTKQVILEDITPQGGKIYLTGRISSTGNGRIVSADGSADVSITNATNRAITVGKVNVGDVDGVITITDTGKNTTTEFRRDSTTTYTIGSTAKTVTGPSSFYSPKTGLYYNWSTGYEQTIYNHYYHKKGFSWWGGYTWNAGSIHELEGSLTPLENRSGGSNKLQGTYIGPVAGATGEYTIFYRNDVGYNNSWYRNWITYDNWTHFSGDEHYDWGSNVGKTVTFQHSLNASNNIGIGFIGSTTGGSVNLTSAKDVNLSGNVSGVANTAINITSSAGAIEQIGGTIVGDNITLNAYNGIGNKGAVYQRVLGDSGILKAITSSGNVNLLSASSIGKLGNLYLTATTNAGNVKVIADGSLLQTGAAVSVKGHRIDLESKNGSVGQSGNALLIQGGQTPVTVGDTMSASVNAAAKGDIYMTQTSGDMRLGRVEAVGNVGLTVSNGSFNNVLPVTEDTGSRSGDDLVAKWIAMGLINADGSDNGAAVKARAIADYENGVKSEFANYVAQKAVYDANPALVKTDAYNTLASKYTVYATAEAFLSAKAADSSSDYYKISHELYGWSKDSLLYALQKSIINPTSGSSQTLVRPANVKGKNITLTALNGGIGKDEAAEVLSIVNLGSNLDALKKLAGAEASDVTWDEAGGIATIRRTTAIGIEMTDANGALNATAKNNIYLAAATDAPVYLNNIDAGTSNIRLLGKSGVYNVSTLPNAVNFKGRDLIVEGGSNGNNSFLGTDVKPLVVDLSGKLTARADSLINIFQTGLNAMQVSAIFGGSDVKLRSAKDLLSVNTGIIAEDLGYINAGGKLTLLSDTGNIGQDSKGIRILGDNTDSVDAEGNNVYIAGESQSSSKPALNLGNVTARNAAGVFKVSNDDSGVNFDGNIIAHTISVAADSLSQNESTGYVKATTLGAVIVNGLSLDSNNNEISQAALSNATTGDIELNNKIGLTLNGVSNSAVAGNVTINNAAAVTTALGISALGDVTIDAVGAFQSTAAVAAGNNVSIESDYGIALNTVSAGNNVTLAAGVGAISATTIGAGQNVTITDNEGNISLTSVTAGNDMTLAAVNGDTAINNAV